MADQGRSELWENVPSPFCGIASDDLKIEARGTRITVVANGDAVTIPGFELPITDSQPRISGRETSLDEACGRAAELLRQSSCPVFSGFGTDVHDTRAALSLIDRCGGVFDQMRAENGLRNLLVLANSGWMATTLGELKNRVDLLLVFGTDIEVNFPRFFERFIWTKDTLFGQDSRQREIVYIGREPSGRAAYSPDGQAPEVMTCTQESLPDVAAALCALMRGAGLQVESVGGLPVAALRALIDRLKKARYSVITWAAGQLNFPSAELTLQQLCQLVVLLNQETRSAVLPLGGQDGDRTASQVCAWQTGYPTRVSFARGYPEYDPYLFDAKRLLESGEADVLVWVSSLSAAPPPVTSTPTVVIGRSGMQFEREPEVFVPVGVPGIDHAGHMYRCDNVVAMPLFQLRDSDLPTAADALRAIERALDVLA